MYIVWRLGRQEVRPDANNDAINASNKMHVGYINVWSAYQWPLLFPRFHHYGGWPHLHSLGLR